MPFRVVSINLKITIINIILRSTSTRGCHPLVMHVPRINLRFAVFFLFFFDQLATMLRLFAFVISMSVFFPWLSSQRRAHMRIFFLHWARCVYCLLCARRCGAFSRMHANFHFVHDTCTRLFSFHAHTEPPQPGFAKSFSLTGPGMYCCVHMHNGVFPPRIHANFYLRYMHTLRFAFHTQTLLFFIPHTYTRLVSFHTPTGPPQPG